MNQGHLIVLSANKRVLLFGHARVFEHLASETRSSDEREMKVLERLKALFGQRPPVGDTTALAEFIDTHAAFIVQKGIYEYSQARAGHYAKVLFSEAAFAEAVERARWSAYPLGLAMVGEMTESVLRPHAENRRAALDALTALVLSVFDRYPVPPSIGVEAWRGMRADLERHLDLVGGHAPKRVIDIPEPLAEKYFALMPIHEKLRGRDFFTTSNYLRVNLCHMHEELEARIDAPAVMDALLARGAKAESVSAR